MATQDNNPGLFSKVAKFVRNPSTDWADLDKMTLAPNSEHSEQGRQALKLMIERKRHNDGVRRREFDQLRKLRQTAATSTAELDQGPLAFRSSTGYSDLDERATTLKKIDEIEAQMSRQWWKGRQSVPSTRPGEDNGHDPKAKRSTDVTAQDVPQDGFLSTQSSDLMPHADDAPTQMGGPSSTNFMASSPALMHTSESSRGFEGSADSVFSESKMMSVDMGKSLSDPEMEEAAIRFANGDDAGAQSVLLAALNTPNIAFEMADGWAAALFDLYRGTGQHSSFEQLSMEYAQRFGRSAPSWFSTPQRLGLAGVPISVNTRTTQAVTGQPLWVCPPDLDDAAVARLRALVSTKGIPYCLNWQPIKNVTPGAALQLAGLFASWCEQPLTLCFEGTDALLQLQKAGTPMSDNTVPSCWWQWRLDTLRLLRQPDEFELVALDFCVTYELSPPSWVLPRCEQVSQPSPQLQAVPTGAAVGKIAAPSIALPDLAAPDLLSPSRLPDRQLALVGDVVGDTEQATRALQADALGHERCVVSCADLIRVDFSAAGSLLNWVANTEAEGVRVEFREVPRLVAAFFNLIGITEHARVTTRTN
jgi:ABC-type transporter Mla MlaB component